MVERTGMNDDSSERALITSTSSDDPDVIQRQIDYTRAQMTSTISQIGERLSPEYLIEKAKVSVKEAAVERMKDMSYQANRRVEEVSNDLGSTVRANPVPVALIGLGLGWLFLSGRNRRTEYEMRSAYPYRTTGYRYYEGDDHRGMLNQARSRMSEAGEAVQETAWDVQNRVGQTAQRAGETVSETAHRVSETVSDKAQQVGDAVSETAQRVGETVSEGKDMIQERAATMSTQARSEAERLAAEARWRAQVGMQRTRQTFWESMESNPLAIGAAVLIAGAAIGAAIPSTEYENKLMGETRDRLMQEAKVRAQDTVERVQTVVEEAQHAAISEARSAAERENLPIGGNTSGSMGGSLASF